MRPDLLLLDAPYSRKTVLGHDAGVRVFVDGARRREMGYQWWEPEDVAECVRFWSPRTRGWFVSITDDVLAPVWKEELARSGRYEFPALPFVERGSRVRVSGDGPSCWTCQVVVARPRTSEFAHWGTLDGAYVAPRGTRERRPGASVVGHKSQWIMRSLIRDYSRPGDLVVDPCAGGGSTLVAACALGRRSLGIELDPGRALLAERRVEEFLAA